MALRNFFLTCFFLVSFQVSADPLTDCKEYAVNGLPGNTGTLLCRKSYLLAHDPVYKTPVWVSEHLTTEKASGGLKRPKPEPFQADPDLSPDTRAEKSDYKKSGYDRGHMAASANTAWDAVAMKESYYLSNMVPQVGVGMNQGIWKNLEEKVRQWAIQRGELYIYTGPVYLVSPLKTIGGNRVAVPSHLYKIIYDPVRSESIAFFMPNIKLKTSDLPNYIVSIRTIEKESGLNFFPEMEGSLQDRIELSKASMLWD